MYSYEDRRCANAVSFVWNTTFAPLSWSGRKFHNSYYELYRTIALTLYLVIS
jgi:hypothetical protein